MYNFIKIQFKLGSVSAEWVQGQVGKWITQTQADAIIKGEKENV